MGAARDVTNAVWLVHSGLAAWLEVVDSAAPAHQVLWFITHLSLHTHR